MDKILVLLYEGFVGFELVFTTFLLKSKFQIVTTAPKIEPFKEISGLLVSAEHDLSEVQMDDYVALVIPGGQWSRLLENPRVTELIQDAHQKGKIIGAICAAPIHLAKAGVLQGRQFTTSLTEQQADLFEWENKLDESVVVDENIVTAKGNAYVEFAFALADQLGQYTEENQAEREHAFKYLKNMQ